MRVTPASATRPALAVFFALALAVALGLAGAEAASVYVSPSGNDASACTQAAPCRSFDRAYRVAQPGEVVEVAGGTYPAQSIGSDSTKTAPNVVFQPAPGATVTLNCSSDGSNCLAVSGDYVTVRNMQTAYQAPIAGKAVQGGVAINRGSNYVVFENIDAGHIWLAGDNLTVLGGDYGPTVDEASTIPGNGTTTANPPRNVVIDGAYFHDHLRDVRHMECLNVWGADGLVIRNSVFNNCAVFSIFVKHFGDNNIMRNITIENNWFANTGGIDQSAQLKVTKPTSNPACHDVLIRFNSFAHGSVISDCDGTNIRWESNIFKNFLASGCSSRGAGTTFNYNVIEAGAKCGANDYVVPDGNVGYVNRAALDLHLTATSEAIGRGNPNSFPATDIDGETRPAGTEPDAGADHLGGGSVSPPAPPGNLIVR
jgi:hypothetical protein